MMTSLFILSCNSDSPSAIPPSIEKGVLDLSTWDLNSGKTIKLEGEWEFYWNQFINSEDFKNQSGENQPHYGKVPGTWNNFTVDGEKITGDGFATYRLKILLKDNREEIVLKFLTIQTAHHIFINGILVGSGGRPGKNSGESQANYNPRTIHFTPESAVVELIIHISNFHHRKGGLWGAVTLGSRTTMQKLIFASRDKDFFIIGAIFIIGIYYLGLFIIRKQEKEAIYFSLYCMAISLRIFVTGEIRLIEYFPLIPWKILIIIEYITFFSSILFFLLFINSLFRGKRSKTLSSIILFTCIIFSLLTIVLPVSYSSYLIPVYQLVTLIVGFHIIHILFLYSLRKDLLAKILLSGFLLMFIIVINDILYAAGIINSVYLISYGILIFIIFQSLVMTIRFANTFEKVERQQKQLQKTNMEYRSEIEERTLLEKELRISYENNAKSRLAIIMGLAKLAEYRDSDTGTHIERIQEYNSLLAKQLQNNKKYRDYISNEYIEDLHISSILHDIGKVGIPDAILQKPGKLTEEEFEIMKNHSVIGGDSIKAVEKRTGVRSFLTLGRDIAYMHHEKWDGSGYPGGLQGEEIPLSARLTALADVYDALTSKRCYKEAFPHKRALEIIIQSKGTHFDPDIVDAFVEVQEGFDQIRDSLQDEISSVME